MRLGRNKIVNWQFKYYWTISIAMNLFLPLLIGFFIKGSLLGATSCFVFVGLGRALQHQITFCVNSVNHMFGGTKEFYDGTARNIWWLSLLLLGENYHNFHHATCWRYA